MLISVAIAYKQRSAVDRFHQHPPIVQRDIHSPTVQYDRPLAQAVVWCVNCVGPVAVTLTDSNGQKVPVRITDNKDKTFRVDFEAPVAGVYSANVTFAGLTVPKSPFKINVESPVDVSKVQVRGLPQSKSAHSPVIIQTITLTLTVKQHDICRPLGT